MKTDSGVELIPEYGLNGEGTEPQAAGEVIDRYICGTVLDFRNLVFPQAQKSRLPHLLIFGPFADGADKCWSCDDSF